MRATTAPLVAHVDDDGTVDSDWLELFVCLFAELPDDVAVIGGEIDPVWETSKPAWLTERMALFLSALSGHGKTARYLTHDECACEGNSCYRRDALVKAGGFPEKLGRAGSLLLSGEQVVESMIRKNGGAIYYDPRLVLHHFIHADRLNPLWLRRRLFWQGVSKCAIRDYQKQHDIPVMDEAFLNLPLKPQDWSFLDRDTSENLEENMFLFHCLGFVLAHSGIIPIER